MKEKTAQRGPEAEALLSGLAAASPAELLCRLPKLEYLGETEPGVAACLLPLLQHADFAVRMRCFLALQRLGDRAVSVPLAEIMQGEGELVWRLLAMETLIVLQEPRLLDYLAPLLAPQTPPLLLRAAVWTAGSCGPEALPLLERFLAQPFSRLLKDELRAEALQMAMRGLSPTEREERLAGLPMISLYLRFRLPEPDMPRFSLYPDAAYLQREAEKHGLDKTAFKRLYRRYRPPKDKEALI